MRASPSPLLWKMLDKKGNSNQQERIELIQRFIHFFGLAWGEMHRGDCGRPGIHRCRMAWLPACRQAGLQAERIPFHIRLAWGEMWLTKPGGEKIRMSWILQSCPLHAAYHHPKMLYLDSVLVYVSGMKLEKGEYLIVVSYDNQQQALIRYKERWSRLRRERPCLKPWKQRALI